MKLARMVSLPAAARLIDFDIHMMKHDTTSRPRTALSLGGRRTIMLFRSLTIARPRQDEAAPGEMMTKRAVDTGLPAIAGRPIQWATIADGILYTAQLPLKADGSFETGALRKFSSICRTRRTSPA
jgi:hypothetical protein